MNIIELVKENIQLCLKNKKNIQLSLFINKNCCTEIILDIIYTNEHINLSLILKDTDNDSIIVDSFYNKALNKNIQDIQDFDTYFTLEFLEEYNYYLDLIYDIENLIV